MSGIDEQVIPYCPNCDIKTDLWRVYKGPKSRGGNQIACFNIDEVAVTRYGEFNFFEVGVGYRQALEVLATAQYMQCGHCGYQESGRLMQLAVNAFKQKVKRYPKVKERSFRE